MEEYEVNVLKRNGGWKKLSHRDKTIDVKKNLSELSRGELSIKIKDESLSDEKDIFNDFEKVNEIISKLKKLEIDKNKLFEQLSLLEEKFKEKQSISFKKLNKIKTEHELYDKTIDLINSLKKV